MFKSTLGGLPCKLWLLNCLQLYRYSLPLYPASRIQLVVHIGQVIEPLHIIWCHLSPWSASICYIVFHQKCIVKFCMYIKQCDLLSIPPWSAVLGSTRQDVHEPQCFDNAGSALILYYTLVRTCIDLFYIELVRQCPDGISRRIWNAPSPVQKRLFGLIILEYFVL